MKMLTTVQVPPLYKHTACHSASWAHHCRQALSWDTLVAEEGKEREGRGIRRGRGGQEKGEGETRRERGETRRERGETRGGRYVTFLVILCLGAVVMVVQESHRRTRPELMRRRQRMSREYSDMERQGSKSLSSESL